MVKIKRTKGQTMIYKTLHRKLKIDQHKPRITIEVKCGTAKVKIICSPPLVVLLVIIIYI